MAAGWRRPTLLAVPLAALLAGAAVAEARYWTPKPGSAERAAVLDAARVPVERYGLPEVRQWHFEVWNEPDASGYFKGTLDEYLRQFAVRCPIEGVLERIDRLRDLSVLLVGDAIVDEYAYCLPLDAGLRLDKTADAGPVDPGDTITYTIQVFNGTPIAQTGVSLTDTLPAGVTFVPGSASGGCAPICSRPRSWWLSPSVKKAITPPCRATSFMPSTSR